MSTRLCHFGGI